MNGYFILGIITVIVSIIFLVPLLADQVANAGVIRKIQFTQTITSSQDPGQGHGSEQMGLILIPNNGTLYHGSLTYTSSEPVNVVILHQIDKSDSKGQPTWTVDGNTIYAETIINSNSNGGSLDFTGSAVGLHSNSTEFTATASVDGWIRGVTPSILQKTPRVISEGILKLSNAETPIKIPLHKGLYDKGPVYYIITDSSSNAEAKRLAFNKSWPIQTAPLLSQLPQKFLGKIYIFTNGIPGNGTKGFQDEVFSITPQNTQYIPLSLMIQVSWNVGRAPSVLHSEKEVLDANMSGRVLLTNTNTVLNTPQIIWPNGQMSVNGNGTLSDQTAYSGGQILGTDTSNMTVTFLAHRGWGPDGKTVYYIATSGTPEGPAKMMGLMNIPALSELSPYSRDIYHFANGIKGAGPFGFQEGISSAQPGDSSYSPICKVSMVTWKDPQSATILENMNDINSSQSSDSITKQPASIYGNNFLIDCPIVEISKSTS